MLRQVANDVTPCGVNDVMLRINDVGLRLTMLPSANGVVLRTNDVMLRINDVALRTIIWYNLYCK